MQTVKYSTCLLTCDIGRFVYGVDLDDVGDLSVCLAEQGETVEESNCEETHVPIQINTYTS